MRRLSVSFLLMILWTACGGSGGDVTWTPVVDLAAELPNAEVRRETPALDLGTAAARPHLLGGFSRDELDPGAGETFVWSTGEVSRLALFLVTPRDLDLVLRGRPFRYPGAGAQRLTVRVGGEKIAAFDLEPRLREYRIGVPGRLLRRGENAVELAYSDPRAPAEVAGGADRRRLAVAWYGLAVGDPAAPKVAEGPRAEGDRLFVPWGSRIDLFLDLPPSAALAADGWSWRGAGTVEVAVLPDRGEGDAGGTVEVLDGPPKAPVDLGIEGPGPFRLRLTMAADSEGNGGTAGGGVLLVAPRIAVAGGEPVDPVVADGPAATPVTDGTRPSLVIYAIDTLRADRLGVHGGAVATPHLDRFAATSVMFERAIAQSSWTRASMGTVMTGLWPPVHGAVGRSHVLVDDVVTLAERLRDLGYRTAAFVTNPNVTPAFGFHQGFDTFVDLGEGTDGMAVNDAVSAWLSDPEVMGDPRPRFLWVHTLDPHAPYKPPEAVRRELAPQVPEDIAEEPFRVLTDLRAGRRPMDRVVLGHLQDLYDAEIAFSDRAFGEFLDLLDASGLGDAVQLVLSDHGEEFMEHGNLEHGRALFVESLWVPMMLRGPGLTARRVPEPVQHLDILPTLLGRLGVAPPDGLAGRDLFADGPGAGPSIPLRPILSHLHLDGPERVSAELGAYKLIAGVDDAGRLHSPRLFDVVADPGELRDLAAERPVRVGYLETLLRKRLASADGVPKAAEAEIDDELRRSLEALGYL